MARTIGISAWSRTGVCPAARQRSAAHRTAPHRTVLYLGEINDQQQAA